MVAFGMIAEGCATRDQSQEVGSAEDYMAQDQNGGYAYGYDPYYSSYSYNEPIYGYQDRDPGQVISSVQTELQRLGYYRYAVDGQMGPATRAAIANYQRDNSLAITSAIDEPTLQSLGLG